MGHYRYRNNSPLTILDGQYGHRVDGPQDSAYVPSVNSDDPGSNQVPVPGEHKDGHLHIYSPALRYAGLNTLISFVTEGLIKLMVQDFVS